jgi:hypothetical protein
MIEAMFEDIALSIIKQEIEHNVQRGKKQKPNNQKKGLEDASQNRKAHHSDNVQVKEIRDITQESQENDHDDHDEHDDMEIVTEPKPKDKKATPLEYILL